MSDRRPGGLTRARAWLRPRAGRLAALLWMLLAVVVWNDVFDAEIVSAGRDYLTRQALHEKNEGPYTEIDAVMGPAVTRGLVRATSWAVAIAGPGLVLVAAASTRARKSRSPGGATSCPAAPQSGEAHP